MKSHVKTWIDGINLEKILFERLKIEYTIRPLGEEGDVTIKAAREEVHIHEDQHWAFWS